MFFQITHYRNGKSNPLSRKESGSLSEVMRNAANRIQIIEERAPHFVVDKVVISRISESEYIHGTHPQLPLMKDKYGKTIQ